MLNLDNLNFNKDQQASTTKADRPKAKIWLNVGYTIQVQEKNPETGVMETVDKFISMPIGIPVDTSEPLEVKGNNADYRALLTARNNLLQKLITTGEGLEPGEERIIPLQVSLRHVNVEAAPINNDDNKYVAALDF